MAHASDPLDYSMEERVATTSGAMYSYDDQAYFTDDENGFEDDLPSCYYPTETNYANLKYCYGHQTRNMPDPCVYAEDMVFNNKSGAFSADQTFYNCMANIPDVASMPTFFNGKYHGCMLILTQVTLLNLVQVNEIEGIVELQIIVDYTWQDRRYNMGEFWKNVPESYSGFDVTAMLTNDSIVMWRPTIVFPDANVVEVMAETLTILPSNENKNISIFMYEATYDLVLVQPGFNFRRYPNDDQDIIIRFSALNFDAEQLQLFPSNTAFITVTILTSIALLFGELFGMRSSYYHAMEALIAKANRPELTTKEFSWIEIMCLNHYLFGEWSTSLHRIAHEISLHGHLHFEKPTSVTLHNMTSLSQVMGGVGSAGGGGGGGGRGRGHGDKGTTATAAAAAALNPMHSLQKRGYGDRDEVDHDGGFQLSVSQPYLEMASFTTAVAAPTAAAAPPSIATTATFATVGSSSPKSPLSPGVAVRPSHHTTIDSDDEPED
eukprot:gene4249-3032_t